MTEISGWHIPTQPSKCITHRWDSKGSWGVIFGVSKCLVCGQTSRAEDFKVRDSQPQNGEPECRRRPGVPAMTVNQRKVIQVAVMSCGCEYAAPQEAQPIRKCPEHADSYRVLIRYESESTL